VALLTFNGETDAFTDGGWNSVGSDAQISGHVVTANFIQIQMSPNTRGSAHQGPDGHYTQTAHTEHHNRNQSTRLIEERWQKGGHVKGDGHIYIKSHAPAQRPSLFPFIFYIYRKVDDVSENYFLLMQWNLMFAPGDVSCRSIFYQ
jgi:hypothetical protein